MEGEEEAEKLGLDGSTRLRRAILRWLRGVPSGHRHRCFTWNAGTQSHESNSRDCIFETDSAAQMRRQITDDSRQDTDAQNGDNEARVTVITICNEGTKVNVEVKPFPPAAAWGPPGRASIKKPVEMDSLIFGAARPETGRFSSFVRTGVTKDLRSAGGGHRTHKHPRLASFVPVGGTKANRIFQKSVRKCST